MRNNQPVQEAELSACPGCGIVCLVCGMINLSRLLNFQPVDYSDFLPACLVRSYEYLPVWETKEPASKEYLLSRMLTDLSIQDSHACLSRKLNHLPVLVCGNFWLSRMLILNYLLVYRMRKCLSVLGVVGSPGHGNIFPPFPVVLKKPIIPVI